mmetsp:Transcript_11826/g.20094  ORF Transcript_11826/g.20094 Transcript_11826/m.20094 type:complete len:151 (-) Transcript_11826:941-1393(-)
MKQSTNLSRAPLFVGSTAQAVIHTHPGSVQPLCFEETRIACSSWLLARHCQVEKSWASLVYHRRSWSEHSTATSHYFSSRKGSTFFITIFAPDVTRRSFLVRSTSILTFLVGASNNPSSLSPPSSSSLAFHRASSSSTVASLITLMCSVL